jgi:uncharacterized small protein (DUF1192 family)
MFEDDASTRPPKAEAPFESLSIDELHARIAKMKAEIARCEAAIAAKQNQKHAADAIFGVKPS